ncbi:hypothetical protein N8198_06410, partial [Gammaproteobacteria bacterium]|nr:hypothetical protein [Gammaproteobacteria bacterium]
VRKLDENESYQIQGMVWVKTLSDTSSGLGDLGETVYRGYFRIAGLEIDGVARLYNNGRLTIEADSIIYEIE